VETTNAARPYLVEVLRRSWMLVESGLVGLKVRCSTTELRLRRCAVIGGVNVRARRRKTRQRTSPIRFTLRAPATTDYVHRALFQAGTAITLLGPRANLSASTSVVMPDWMSVW
jgi:hypothetical protein